MKITKSIDEINYYKQLQEKANEGCYVCPGCGATGVRDYNSRPDSNKKIIHSKSVRKTFWTGTCYRIDQYRCKNCGCEWQSEEYEFKY